ncbi:hypothetical protein BDZ45DRAFT_698193 [Acephala macrosclerotiorum]|nr:hypothetical protein BDZ45DRAFT_698193 [Acephala macrosclerotiorum]
MPSFMPDIHLPKVANKFNKISIVVAAPDPTRQCALKGSPKAFTQQPYRTFPLRPPTNWTMSPDLALGGPPSTPHCDGVRRKCPRRSSRFKTGVKHRIYFNNGVDILYFEANTSVNRQEIAKVAVRFDEVSYSDSYRPYPIMNMMNTLRGSDPDPPSPFRVSGGCPGLSDIDPQVKLGEQHPGHIGSTTVLSHVYDSKLDLRARWSIQRARDDIEVFEADENYDVTGKRNYWSGNKMSNFRFACVRSTANGIGPEFHCSIFLQKGRLGKFGQDGFDFLMGVQRRIHCTLLMLVKEIETVTFDEIGFVS